ncbi:AAA family ATPase [Streptomyces justiciae]|uniref:AAA family ATPase n=1 Tax=Streptomyces justiciae TaxID=2780140 RepID=UPI00187F2B5D|nr:AAA family ATPase [Streptomyces justiciae]MBE8471066.1 AAA family ATPase [Streptomyces justiciae]
MTTLDRAQFCTHNVGGRPCDAVAARHEGGQLGHPFTPPRSAPPAPAAEMPQRRIKLTAASAIAPEPVIWAWEPESGEGRIPAGALTLAAGREGTGKSSFGIWLAARLSRGELPGTFYGQPKNVLYAAVEDSWSRTLVPRLIAAGADLERVFRVDAEDMLRGETMISLPLDVSLIEQAIAEHDVAALIVDPLMSTLGSSTDAHRTQDVRQALEPLVRMAERTKALTLGIAHFNKGNSTDPSQLISGSGAFKDLARAVLAFARDRETDEQVMTQTKNSLGRLDLPSLAYCIEGFDVPTAKGTANVGRLVFLGVSERTVEDTLSAPVDRDDVSERDEAVAWLTDYLTDNGGEASAGDVLKAGEKDGFSKRTLQRARAKAGVSSQKSAFNKGWVWVLSVTDLAEGAAKVPKAPGPTVLAPSAPSLSPSPLRSLSVVADVVLCTVCKTPLDPVHCASGETAHPNCEPAREAS